MSSIEIIAIAMAVPVVITLWIAAAFAIYALYRIIRYD